MEGNVYGLSSSLNIQHDIGYRKIVLSDQTEKLGSISASEVRVTMLKESSIICLIKKEKCLIKKRNNIVNDSK